MDADRVGDLFRFLGGRSIVGRLAVLHGYLTDDQLEAARAADPRPIGDVLVELGFLTEEQKADLEQQEAEILRGDRAEPSGRAIGHYLLVEQLGGGMAGIVWRAWDTRLQRWVAVKEARDDVPFARERFLREARAASKVSHPHLVQALEVGRHEDRDFIVMTLAEGKPLDQVPMPAAMAAAVLADIAEAVSALHAAGVLHRDIKPQNILIDDQGRGRLADFGIARDRSAPPLTLEGTLLGTPVYMAPEQAHGKPDLVREPADVYGLGSTLYHAVTGRAPFLAEDDLRILLRRLSDEAPPAPRDLAPDLPEDLDFIIRRAIEKHPEDRYPSATALAEDLRRFLRGEPLAARPAGPIARSARFMKRQPRRLALGLLAAAVLVTAVVSVATSQRKDRYLAEYQAGVDLFTRGSTPDALIHFNQAASISPGQPEAWLMKGRCHARLKQQKQATEAWTEALARDPSYGPALLERGKAAVDEYLQRRLPPVTRVSGGQVRFGPLPPETLEDRQRRTKGEQDLDRARKARGLEPVELRFLEGAMAFGQGDFGTAVKALGEYASRSGWDPAGHSLFAAAAFMSGDYETAEKAWTRAIELQPRPDRLRARGDARYCLGRYAAAIEDYAKADEDAAARCSRGLALQALGRTPEAVDQYTRALELRPHDARSLNNRGTAKAELLDFAGAQKDFEDALEANEFYAEAYHNLGNALLLQNRPDDAIRQYDLALGCDEDYVDAYLHRARARMKAGRPDAAAEDLSAALRREPSNADALLDLATLTHTRGDRAAAVQLLEKALAAAPAAWPPRPRAEKLLAEWKR